MTFQWDDEEKEWHEGEPPKRNGFMEWAKNKPTEFTIVFVIIMLWFSIYSGKVILWVVRLFTT